MSTELEQYSVPRRDRVYTGLRDELVSGRISPFDRLAEERIAQRYAVSRTPVREALARLCADGLIQRRDSGWYLHVPSFDALTGLYELRLTLELRGIYRAIEEPSIRHDATSLEGELKSWYDHRDRPPSPDAGFVVHDERFHTALLDSSGNPELTRALEQVNQKIRAVRMFDYLTEDRIAATISEHIEIAELVLTTKLPQALDALRDHIGASRQVALERAGRALAVTHLAPPRSG